MDERLALEQVRAEVEGRVLREGIPDGEDHIGVTERLHGAAVAAIAEHALRQRVILVDDTLAVERGDEGDLKLLDQPLQLGPRVASDRAEADEGQDALALLDRLGEHAGGGGDLSLIR